jgi:hypothetical protein
VLANQAFEAGDYAQAARGFTALASAAETRGGPRAPQFHFQAGRASLLAGQKQDGLDHLQRGLSLLSERGDTARLEAAGKRITAELEARGFHTEAGQISAWLAANLPEGRASPPPAAPRPAALPTHCPSCGAIVRPDEVEWLDEITAECTYCGSPLRAEA